MKKGLKWIQELTLTHQLMVIILVFTLSFCTFLFVLLGRNINDFVEGQMYHVLQLSQDDIVFNYQQGISINTLIKRKDPSIGHVLRISNTNYLIGMQDIDQLALEKMLSNAAAQENQSQKYQYHVGGKTLYYMIRRIDSDTVFISYMNQSFGNTVKNTLLSDIINITVFVVFILFVLLLIWVASIITPLKQLRNYIDKIKLGQRVDLKVSRQDEIGELAQAMIDMRDALDYQEEMKNELIHNMSHDLKTPIATIKSYGESIKDGIYPYETLEKSVDVIIEHATRLEKKVHSLLLLNRLSYLENEHFEMTEVDMVQVIQQVLLAIKVIKPNIQIETNLMPGVVFQGNEESWRVVAENLIDNALRYAKNVITISLKKDELIVENDGKNIVESNLSSIFKAYEKGCDGKFGLGLSIVYKVVTKSGYFVIAENLVHGVRFRIYKVK